MYHIEAYHRFDDEHSSEQLIPANKKSTRHHDKSHNIQNIGGGFPHTRLMLRIYVTVIYYPNNYRWNSICLLQHLTVRMELDSRNPMAEQI